ncbi:MAG TPA: hypothetical protein VK802_20155 [Streptosporangiaceae bacterium]|nr:hypothetical protein [Streptosporangiaceae bacterium]
MLTNQGLALGGGGIGSLIVHLFIWHEIFRLIRLLWFIPTVGPFIVVLLGILLIGGMVWRKGHGPVRRGPIRWGRRRTGSTGYGTGGGPRDW